jgi:hypothetical protein
MEMAMRKFKVVILCLIIFFLTYNVSLAQNRKAPEWIISEWINGPGVTLGELKGRVRNGSAFFMSKLHMSIYLQS